LPSPLGIKRAGRENEATGHAQSNPLLDNVSIVLVATRYPANIGSTARCMMNMGLNRSFS
jgi:hypothetical protein